MFEHILERMKGLDSTAPDTCNTVIPKSVFSCFIFPSFVNLFGDPSLLLLTMLARTHLLVGATSQDVEEVFDSEEEEKRMCFTHSTITLTTCYC